jgi:DNA end-binding protein Ku
MPKRKTNFPRAIWSGSISFGLVNIPVKLYSAIRPKDLHFHMLHNKDKARVEQKLVCPVEGKEISRDEIVKGYEVGPGQHVVVQPEELNSLMPKASRMIEIVSFVKMSEIDPIYFDKPYYLMPDERAEKAYTLFLEAMKRSKKVGIAKFVMRNKEYLSALRPFESMLCLETMHFADEVVSGNQFEGMTHEVKIGDREIKTAEQLIDSLSGRFEPEKIHDDYREAVMKMIDKKAEGEEIVVQPEEETEKPEVIDLMAALEASLAEAKKKNKRKSA